MSGNQPLTMSSPLGSVRTGVFQIHVCPPPNMVQWRTPVLPWGQPFGDQAILFFPSVILSPIWQTSTRSGRFSPQLTELVNRQATRRQKSWAPPSATYSDIQRTFHPPISEYTFFQLQLGQGPRYTMARVITNLRQLKRIRIQKVCPLPIMALD